MAEQPIASGFRYSLRGLLLATAFVAVACVSLKYASPLWWTILSAATLLLFMAVTVLAFTGSAEQRTKAIGFSVCFIIYGGLLYLSPSDELRTDKGILPTTKIMRPVVGGVVKRRYIDLSTGKVIPDYVEKPGEPIVWVPREYEPGDVILGGGGNPPPATMGTHVFPEPKQVMTIAHLLWAVLFGILGSMLAGIVYARSESSRQ